VRIHLAAEHSLQLEFAHFLGEARRFVLEIAKRGFVALRFGQGEQLIGTVDGARSSVELLDLRGQPRAFLAELLRACRDGPDTGILELPVDLLEPLLFLVVFKETPVARSCARRDP
jgi:hypothetical protein